MNFIVALSKDNNQSHWEWDPVIHNKPKKRNLTSADIANGTAWWTSMTIWTLPPFNENYPK